MVLESTVICVDNSDFMRNGDFSPSRLQAQQDAVNLLCNAKTRSNPENNVALVTLANSSEVLTTLTTDVGKVMAKLQQVQPKGEVNFLTGVRIAHLALRHRQGRNHRMRIIVFVGSPLKVTPPELSQLAKKLKKEKVNVDIVNFGEETVASSSQQDDNSDLLQAFIEELRGKDGSGSHLATLVGGCDLVDSLARSAIVKGEDGSGASAAAAAGGSSGGGFEFGVDPNEDPELAMALRVSMEEQRQRQEREARAAAAAAPTTAPVPGESRPANTSESWMLMRVGCGMMGLKRVILLNYVFFSAEEENMLVQAITGAASLDSHPAASGSSGSVGIPDFGSMSEEDQLAYAIQVSMQEAQEENKSKKKTKEDDATPGKKPDEKEKRKGGGEDQVMEVDTEEDLSAVVQDAEFLESVLGTLPGVNVQSDAVQSVVGELAGRSQERKPSEGEEGKKTEKK
ncbi:unnamed protein product [Notodromas monacha]|uniref:26S proteasome non-ATPase regulatory subunit 4 n=1 Tax=Notodromas monacha TaxID=399045 RepID=A0A7R9GA61_9CRUS|nr:unnamed protein product [Notodromas monacha]CAG0913355.1 unnamed protein product [Notodromas monacha]